MNLGKKLPSNTPPRILNSSNYFSILITRSYIVRFNHNQVCLVSSRHPTSCREHLQFVGIYICEFYDHNIRVLSTQFIHQGFIKPCVSYLICFLTISTTSSSVRPFKPSSLLSVFSKFAPIDGLKMDW